MDTNGSTNGEVEDNPLTPEEQAILTELQDYFARGCDDVPEEFAERMKATLRWSWDDPASIKRALYFASRSPYYLQEMKAIERDFARWDAKWLQENGACQSSAAKSTS